MTGEVGAMAEVRLARLARVTMRVVEEVLPAYQSTFPKHVFTQSQLFGVLCLRRYEDWTIREAEARLVKHAELRAALGTPYGARSYEPVSLLNAVSMRVSLPRY
jgi:hypothetical protein